MTQNRIQRDLSLVLIRPSSGTVSFVRFHPGCRYSIHISVLCFWAQESGVCRIGTTIIILGNFMVFDIKL